MDEDDYDVYNSVDDKRTTVLFRDIIRAHGEPIVVPKEQLTSALSHGQVSFHLNDDFVDDLLAAIDIGEPLDTPEAEPSPPAEADSEALQQHQQRMRAEARLDFQGQVERQARTRGPPRAYRDFSLPKPTR